MTTSFTALRLPYADDRSLGLPAGEEPYSSGAPPPTSLYGIWCMAHGELGEILLMALTISSVQASVDQGSTDLYIGLGLTQLSASVLQCIPYVYPATSQTIADWQ